jgi:hypothetical protein
MNQIKLEQIRKHFIAGLQLIDEIAIQNNYERWRTVTNYENYKISSFGRMKRNGKILKPCIGTHGYQHVNLYKNGKAKNFMIHRLVAIAFIENAENNKYVDHKNNDKKNNNVNNLRWCTQQQNTQNASLPNNNTSGVKGVYFNKKCKKWQAQITINKKRIFIGRFETLEDAKDARQAKAKELFGEFLNECEL